MSYGTQFFDGNGRLRVRITDRLTRILGSVETGTSDGSISVPAFAGRQPFAQLALNSGAPAGSYFAPEFEISGTTLSWRFLVAAAAYRANARIIYGIVG